MNRNRAMLLVIFIVVMQAVSGQEYLVQGISPNLFLSHKVAAKETWYSMGRSFNLSPKEIATYNRLSIDKPLEIGQTIKVPLSATNFSQNDVKAQDEVFVPVYHTVQEKEWMYRISVNHNKVPIEKLEKWNAISSTNPVKPGMNLIIGYLKVKELNGTATNKNTVADKPSVATKETPKPAEPERKPEPTIAQTRQVSSTASADGYFKSQFENSGKKYSGVAGIFKSTSGWNDGKYYVLMSNVTVGTIVKITYVQTNKAIYAKVLGELPDMKESAGLGLRISDAAAKELEAVSNKFSVEIGY
jgi:LysM repeat protein